MISIVIPLFNEHESILDLYSEICNAISSYNDWEIIFIDDGSSDGSAEKIIDIYNMKQRGKISQRETVPRVINSPFNFNAGREKMESIYNRNNPF